MNTTSLRTVFVGALLSVGLALTGCATTQSGSALGLDAASSAEASSAESLVEVAPSEEAPSADASVEEAPSAEPSSVEVEPAMPAPGDAAWASSNDANGLTGQALLDAVLNPQTVARIAVVNDVGSSSQSTQAKFSDGKGNWQPERQRLHKRILDRAMAAAASVPNNRQALLAGGLPGAGKTTFLKSTAAKDLGITLADYLTINPDDMKEVLIDEPGAVPKYPGLGKNEVASLIHAESAYLADELMNRALAEGKNILIDRTMGAAKPVAANIKQLKDLGYEVTSIYIESTPAESLARAEYRYRTAQGDYSGRPVAFASIADTRIDEQGRSANRVVFETVAAPASKLWILVDHHKLGSPVVLSKG